MIAIDRCLYMFIIIILCELMRIIIYIEIFAAIAAAHTNGISDSNP